MLKKFFVSAALAATAVGGMGLGAGTAFAGDNNPDVAAGVYPSYQACMDAGYAGVPQDRWISWRCDPVAGGQYLLWVGGTR
ncbi:MULTISPECIES: hypothetical protein [unclassified Streptomyces]|uniref:hypothetical protein n=1 Tax=unclassified Streptomyces TaxID=2593676 RepID=UPI0004C1D7A8|nr:MULTISPECIES: hypothetical protein [unclassified Streptomyces]